MARRTGLLSGGLRGDRDLTAEIAQASNEAVDDFGAITPVKVIRAEVVVFDAVAQHEVGGSEHRSGDGEDGLLGAAAGPKAEELSLQVTLLYPNARPCGGDERGLEPGVALADPGRTALACALSRCADTGRPKR